MNIASLLREGIGLQQSGRFAEAERIYRAILDGDAAQPDALHLLGLAAHQQGRAEEAVDKIRRAIQIYPAAAAFYNNLGNALRSLGRLAEAVGAFEAALRLEPANAAACLNLGNAHFEAGRMEAALASYHEAARLDPRSAEARNNLGNALARTGRPADALREIGYALELRPAYPEARVNRALVLASLGRLAEAEWECGAALEMKPGFAEAHAALGSVKLGQGQVAAAEAQFLRALELQPGYPEALANLSQALAAQGRWGEAESAARQALLRDPPLAAALNNLGLALDAQGRAAEAEAAFRAAAANEPENWEAHYNLGNILRDRRAVEEAVESYGRAIEANPQAPLPHWNRALARLWLGDYERGFNEYEWRWKRPGVRRREFPKPEWDGRPPAGRTLLLYAEQGLGDTIQFLRYARMAAGRGARVIVECQAPLVELAREVEGVAACVAAGDPLPAYDAHAPLLSLPRLFGTRAAEVPWIGPYLPVRMHRGRPPGPYRIGLAWAGNPEHPNDARRSCGFRVLEPLVCDAAVAASGVEFHSLQKSQAPEGLIYSPEIESFRGVASYIERLDLVISVDSSLAHLAAAMGKRVWLMLAYICDWRWGMDGESTGWYPSMRLYRQSQPGDWDSVVKVLIRSLVERNA